MPFQGTELQALLCPRYAKENGFFYDINGDAFIKAIDGWGVRALSDDDGDVLVTDYGANGLKIEKRKTSMSKPYGKRKRCKTAEEAISEFTSTPDNNSPHNCKADDTAALPKCVTEKDIPSNCSSHDEADTSTGNVAEHDTPDNCTDVNIVSDADYVGGRELVMGKDGKLYRMRIGGDDAGVIDGLCRDYESERASFKKLADECIKSCYFKKSCAFTLTTYVPQSFADIKSAVSKMVKKYLFSKFENLKCVFTFCEPHADGSWHCHLILCFRDEFPDGLYETVLKSWKNRIIVPSETYKTDENLVDLRFFYTAEEFIKYLDYLNPVSKKKRDRLKFYPNKKKARQKYGETEKPKKVILSANEAKKLTEREHIALRHEIKILNASSSVFEKKEDLKLHNFTYYYTRNEALWNAIIANGQSSC
ncbi:MAG: hypothetical protein IJB68_01370 [Ruminococcus sp.]|nr:hypothetical protein [Ruminococcus sp.]